MLSIALPILGTLDYCRSMLYGSVRPNMVSWSVWTIAPLVAAQVALKSGATWGEASRIIAAATLAFSVVSLGFITRRGYVSRDAFDILCGSIAISSLIVWWGLSFSRTALLLALIADVFATAPTVRNSWISPNSESLSPYLAGLMSSVLSLSIQEHLTVDTLLFPLYFVVLNSVVICTLLLARRIQYPS
jgi:hypothetical protein